MLECQLFDFELENLIEEHRKLDECIKESYKNYQATDEELTRMKLRKLELKRRISEYR
jgi:uncharacterized protein YdcH (DUF465 family)